MNDNEVWILFGIYYEEDFYECEEVISVHAQSHSAHEHKEFLEKYSDGYISYKIENFEVLKNKQS